MNEFLTFLGASGIAGVVVCDFKYPEIYQMYSKTLIWFLLILEAAYVIGSFAAVITWSSLHRLLKDGSDLQADAILSGIRPIPFWLLIILFSGLIGGLVLLDKIADTQIKLKEKAKQ